MEERPNNNFALKKVADATRREEHVTSPAAPPAPERVRRMRAISLSFRYRICLKFVQYHLAKT
jgi:hypothetical protein